MKRRSLVALSVLVQLGLLPGCGEKKSDPAPAPALTASAETIPAVSASASASATPPPGPASSATAGAKGTFKGAFTAKVGSVTTPKDIKDSTVAPWAKDPGKESVGPGSLEIVIEGTRVSGTGKGSLGDLVLEGMIDGNDVRAIVNPTDPNAPTAMTGVFSGTVSAGKIAGTIRASGRNGNIVREASVTLAP